MSLVLERPRAIAPADMPDAVLFQPPGDGGLQPLSRRALQPAWQRAVVKWWPWALALVALGVYIGAGYYLLYSVHYAIGDALVRAGDARAVLYSRDPHLAAWGFVWFPGPVVLELPFMAIASPLNYAPLAGPVTTAACGAATVLVLVRLFRRLGLGELTVAGLTLTYCLNPVIIFYAANGMSEASYYLAVSVFVLGIVQWFKDGGPRSLIVMSLGLGATMAIRQEAIFLVPIVAALVAFRERGWARRAKIATLVALPGIFVFALWTLANWLIMGNPLFWFESGAAAPASPGASGGVAHVTLAAAIAYSLSYLRAFVPALFVVVPVLFLFARSRSRRWELLSVLGATAVVPGLITLLLASKPTYGDARYYASTTIYATVLLGFAAREVVIRRRLSAFVKGALCVALVALGALDAASGTRNDINPSRTQVESEYVAFRAAFGLAPGCTSYCPPGRILPWQEFDDYIDPFLAVGRGDHGRHEQCFRCPAVLQVPKAVDYPQRPRLPEPGGKLCWSVPMAADHIGVNNGHRNGRDGTSARVHRWGSVGVD